MQTIQTSSKQSHVPPQTRTLTAQMDKKEKEDFYQDASQEVF